MYLFSFDGLERSGTRVPKASPWWVVTSLCFGPLSTFSSPPTHAVHACFTRTAVTRRRHKTHLNGGYPVQRDFWIPTAFRARFVPVPKLRSIHVQCGARVRPVSESVRVYCFPFVQSQFRKRLFCHHNCYCTITRRSRGKLVGSIKTVVRFVRNFFLVSTCSWTVRFSRSLYVLFASCYSRTDTFQRVFFPDMSVLYLFTKSWFWTSSKYY
jgi:hypothetical protein